MAEVTGDEFPPAPSVDIIVRQTMRQPAELECVRSKKPREYLKKSPCTTSTTTCKHFSLAYLITVQCVRVPRPFRTYLKLRTTGHQLTFSFITTLLHSPSSPGTSPSLRRANDDRQAVLYKQRMWEMFKSYHYMDSSLNQASTCAIARWGSTPVGFVAVLPQPGNLREVSPSTNL